MNYSSWGCKESDMTEWARAHAHKHTHTHTHTQRSQSTEKNIAICLCNQSKTLRTSLFDRVLGSGSLSFRWQWSSQFGSDQSLSHVRLFATPWITARQASLSITNSRSSLRLTFIESVMPSSRLILCRPLLLLPPIPPSIRVFSNESALRMRWPKYWSFGFSIIPSKEIPGLISFRMDWLNLLAVQGAAKSQTWLSD